MATITASDLKLRARQRADMENSEFVSDSELLYYVNNSYAELYDILVAKFEDYYVKNPPYEFTLAGSDYAANLPADFYKLRGVDRQSGSDWYNLRLFQFEQRNDTGRGGHWALAESLRYRIYGNQIIISPSDQASGTYKIWYVPKFTPLVADVDTVDGVNGWEEYIVVDAAIKCLQKEESSTTTLEGMKKALLVRINSMATNRDAGEPERVTDMASRRGMRDVFDYGGW